jgi:hypothetical protein
MKCKTFLYHLFDLLNPYFETFQLKLDLVLYKHFLLFTYLGTHLINFRMMHVMIMINSYLYIHYLEYYHS